MSADKTQSHLVENALRVCCHLLNHLARVLGEKTHQILHLHLKSRRFDYLLWRSVPVLAGKGVDRVFLDSKADAPFNRFLKHFRSLSVSLDHGKIPRPRPAPVPIHNHGDMILRE